MLNCTRETDKTESINFQTHLWAKKNQLPSIFLKETKSTNRTAKISFPKTGENFHLYLTDHQSQGLGRWGRSWKNLDCGEILLSTWCFKLNKNPQPILTPLLGLALRGTLLNLEKSLLLRVKAPNDLYLNGGKMAGFLVESFSQGTEVFLFVGLGMNVLASPKLQQPTSFLGDSLKITQALWFSFCSQLHLSFTTAVEKGQKRILSHGDRQALKSALNFQLPEKDQYTDVSPSCDLIRKKGVPLRWKDL